MPPEFLDIPQGSPEWHAVRCGCVTASHIADMMARTKSGWGASRATYEAELVAERLTGIPAEHYTNAAMQWGTDHEPQARAIYAFLAGVEVTEAGFVRHPTIRYAGCSPDGLVGTDGLVEFKCPSTATHIATLRSGAVPDRYLKQMQFQMACTGRAWCDFVSFDPRMPTDLQMFTRRVPRDAEAIAEIEREVVAFLDGVENIISELRPRAAFEASLASHQKVGPDPIPYGDLPVTDEQGRPL